MQKSFREASEIDGYEELRPEDQAKVIKAWQDGHVADEDIPDSARKAVDEDAEEKPKKARKAPAKKKKADESDGEAVEKPKKSKAAKVRLLLLNNFICIDRDDNLLITESCERRRRRRRGSG